MLSFLMVTLCPNTILYKTGFLIYYCFIDWLRPNYMEVFHYVAEKLRLYPVFENKNKSIKINKMRGAVYNDFAILTQPNY